ncbi:MAG: hypothetical protein LKJ28_03290, partial [Bifidobacteriaceae bacterium]|nr:hypothetical protein [Bifidobacteriaceae bacterium]
MITNLEGKWSVTIGDNIVRPVTLPGTLDENGIGVIDVAQAPSEKVKMQENEQSVVDLRPWVTRLTRKHTFEGKAEFSKKLDFAVPSDGKRTFLEIERARCLRLFIDNYEVDHFIPASLSTPHIFEVTNLIKENTEMRILSDNSYPGLPHDAIVYSSTATDETQTNWNGLLGYIRLRTEESTFIHSLAAYPHGNLLDVTLQISSSEGYSGVLTLESASLRQPQITERISIPRGLQEVHLKDLALKTGLKKWDEFEGNLYYLSACLSTSSIKTVRFGIRDFNSSNGRLALNGRPLFLRSEANCAEFPETGYPPMSVDEWREILTTYKNYGINCVRFHSHCPPDAAFTVADELGMMMQPELSHWDPHHAFESDKSFNYYKTELEQIIRHLSNHPSFVMLTLGNELATGDKGHERMSELLQLAHTLDSTRLYANGSNPHYGAQGYDQDSDFYTSQAFHECDLRATFAEMHGFLNHRYPNSQNTYDDAMNKIREHYSKPVFGFEVGQYEVLPAFDEIDDFKGVTDPANYRIIRDRVHNSGLEDQWHEYVAASGELSLLCYREEVEASMRTKDFSGLSLLGVQDFPGQGTALVGMLNAHLKPKPYSFAQADRFNAFFTDQLPLALLPKYTYSNNETLNATIKVANYGKTALAGSAHYKLTGHKVYFNGDLEQGYYPAGNLLEVGSISLPLGDIKETERLNLTIEIAGITNTYPVWVYPSGAPVRPDSVYETEHFDEDARNILHRG